MSQQKPSYSDMYGSEYFRPEDLPRGGVRVKFVKADVRELRCQESTKWKVVLAAVDIKGQAIKKMIAVNKTSAKQMAAIWGKPADDAYSVWIGKLADLTHVRIKAFGKLHDAVLITPVVAAVEGDSFENASPVVDVAPLATEIKRPQKKAEAPKTDPTPQPEAPVIDNETGEVFEPGSFEAPEEPLDDVLITDIKNKDGVKTPSGAIGTVWFIFASDKRVYTTWDDKVASTANDLMAAKRGAIITHDAPLRNSKGVEYFPIVSLK